MTEGIVVRSKKINGNFKAMASTWNFYIYHYENGGKYYTEFNFYYQKGKIDVDFGGEIPDFYAIEHGFRTRVIALTK